MNNTQEEKKKKIYLSGSISKKENCEEDFNNAEKVFSDANFDVVNPVSFDSTKNYKEIMKRDLLLLLDCDFIFFVNDVTTSKGAFIEKIVAEECGIPILIMDNEGE